MFPLSLVDLSKTILRPYQQEPGRAILDSIIHNKGLTFTLEIARQGGKNELSAQLELTLLFANMARNKNLIKCSPTFKPQTVVSMMRLKEKLNNAGLRPYWASEMGYIIRLMDCRAIFLSAEDSANVVGNTAHLLLEVDEAQDVSEDKFTKEFRPMGSTTNVTTVLYGTTWAENTLLEKMKQTNLEKERRDGIRRHYQYDWQEVAKYVPAYQAYVESERDRLGENHPLFMTQYRLLPIHGGGGFLNTIQLSQLQGTHSRQSHPNSPIVVSSSSSVIPSSLLPIPAKAGIQSPALDASPSLSPTYNLELKTFNSPSSHKIYVAGIDLAGEAETGEDDHLRSLKPRQDSTVVTIAELIPSPFPTGNSQLETGNSCPSPSPETYNFQLKTYNSPSLLILQHYSWTGIRHPDLYPQLIDLLKNVWRCKRILVDATGIGQPVASFLKAALGSRVIPFTFTAAAKSELGFNLLSAINSGKLRMYAPDNSLEYREFWLQMEKARSFYRPSQTMNFYVDPADGHDDYLMSLALLVEAARDYRPRIATGR